MKPIGVFVQFLKDLEGENGNRRKSFRETEGESTVDFFTTQSLRNCHTLERHYADILFQEKQG